MVMNLTPEDIQKLIEAFQESFPTKGEFEAFREEMRQNFSDLQISVDTYSKKADEYFQEMVMLSHKVNRHEKWLLQLAEKLGIKLEY